MEASTRREYLERVLDRAASAGVACAAIYWSWAIFGEYALGAAEWGRKAWAFPGTALFLTTVLGLRKWGKLPRGIARILIVATATIWLGVFYLAKVRFVELSPSLLHQILLASSTCLYGMYVLHWVVKLSRQHPDAVTKILFAGGAVGVVALSCDMFMSGTSMYHTMARSDSVAYHPVFTYRDPGTYVLSHEREKVVADFRGTKFQQKKPAGVRRIILNGGSTIWGHGLTKEQSLGCLLMQGLNKAYPEQKWEVICIAHPGKYQLNELVDTAVSLPQWSPDLVLSFNGYNEIWYGEAPSRYVGMPYIENQVEFPLYWSLFGRHSHLGSVLLAKYQQRQTNSGNFLKDPDLEAPARYYDYLRSTAHALRDSGVPYAFAYCPNVMELQFPLGHDKSLKEKTGARKCTSLGEKETMSEVVLDRRQKSLQIIEEEGQFSYDAMRVLDGRDQAVFLDECHLTRHATELIADDLIGRIPQWMGIVENRTPEGEPRKELGKNKREEKLR